MSQSFSLRANHRDTFRLVPVGSTNPGDYIHSPTDPSGFAFFVAEPANYHVYCRPAYTGEFTLLSSSVDGGYQYLRTLNPEIDADGVISLSTLVNNLTVYLDSEHGNLPYITANETLSIRVLSTAGGVPTSELQQAPDVTIYKKENGTGSPVAVGTATYNSALYNTDNPHIYHYTYSFTDQDDEDLYYPRAYAAYEEILSTDYPDTPFFYLDYVPPVLVDQISVTSSSSADAGFTATTTVITTLPETSVTDTQSGPGLFHLQPYLGSLVQTNDPSPAPGGFKYIGWNAGGYHQFDEDHLDDWAMTVASGYMLILTDDNGKEFLYNNHGAAYPSVNQYTLHEIGSAGNTKEIHIPDLDINGGPVDTGTDAATFTAGNYYQYQLFPYPIKAYCKGDPAITAKAACETANHTWLTDQGAVADWPISFAHGGNLAQSLSLTQNVDPGFIDDLEGIKYGYLVSATDNAKNTNTVWSEFLKPSIVYDTIVELAPNLSWQWIKNYKTADQGAFTNENGWFNTGAEFLTDGWCDDDSGDNQQDCCENNGGTWNNNACTSASTTWYADRLTLLVTCTNEQTNQDNLFGVQASHDGINWTEFSGSGNAYLINGQTSQFWISTVPATDLVKQGNHTLYLRSVNTDGGATGNTYAVEYKWDKQKPEWTTAGNLSATGGFNRANITWTSSPLDDGQVGTTNEVGSGGALSTGEGFSGISDIRLYRSKKTSTTPDDWSVVLAAPTTYELVDLGIFPGTTKDYTDTSFYNVEYDAEVIDPYYYWGVPIDVAGNEGQAFGVDDAILLTTVSGVEVTPLVAADVAGALGTTVYADPADATSLITKTDISVPTTGLVFRTDNMNVVRSIKELSYSSDGYTYTSIPIVKRLGENYPVLYADMSYNSTTLNQGINLILQASLATLGLEHLDGVTGEGGHLGLSYIRIASCEVASNNINSPTEDGCATQGGTWSESFKPVIINSVSDLNNVTTIALDTLDNTYGLDLATKLTEPEWKIDIGLIVSDNAVYAFDFPDPLQNQFYYKMTFENNVPTAGYCLGFPAYTDQVTCESNTKTWIDSWINLSKIDWTTQLAADLIVGGTLRLETGLNIWSGGYVDGEPQGTGLTMDELGMRMFKDSNTTVELDAADGSFKFGNLSDPSGNKLQFDPATGQLTLIGNLYQIQSQSGNYSPNYAGEWTAGICDGSGSAIVGTACSAINTEDNCGTGGNCDEKTYVTSDVVLYSGNYWLCITNQSNSVEPSETADLDWSLYASGSIEGKSAQSLFLNAAAQFFTASQDDVIQSPDTIKINANTQGIPSNITWSIAAWDAIGQAIDCSGSNGINLYTDEINGLESPLNLSPTTPVYLYGSNFQSAGAERAEITVSYSEITDDGVNVAGLTDTITVHRLKEGSDSYNIILSNESHTVSADEFGNVDNAEWAGATTTVQLFRGIEARECVISSSTTQANWNTVDTANTLPLHPVVSLSNITNAAGDPTTAWADIVVTDPDNTDWNGSTSTFTVTKLVAGSDSKSISLLPDYSTYTYDPNGQVIVSPQNNEILIPVGLQGGVIPHTLTWTITTPGGGSWQLTYVAGQAFTDYDDIEVISNSSDVSIGHKIKISLDGSSELYKANSVDIVLSITDTTSDPNQTLTYTDSTSIQKLNLGSDALIGDLTNENYSLTAAYTGEPEDLGNAGGVFSVFQGANLLSSPTVEFETVGSWQVRYWKEESNDSIIGSLADLNFTTLNGLGAPDGTKHVPWSDLNANSQLSLSATFTPDPGDYVVSWATTYVKVGSDINILSATMSGDNEFRIYIDGFVYHEGDWNTGDITHAEIPLHTSSGLTLPSNWGTDPTEHVDDWQTQQGPWHRIDMMWHEATGGDHVYCGFNMATEDAQGGGAAVLDIDSATGAYNVLHFDPSAQVGSGSQLLEAIVTVDDGNGGSLVSSVKKEYTITKAFAGSPGTYYKSLFLTIGISTYDALEAAIGDDDDTQWPLDEGELEGLDGWINNPPPDAIPGLTTWETRKLYRTDDTEIAGEVWSAPFVAGSVPLDPIIYYLKPTNGTAILNGNGTLNVIAVMQDQTNGETALTTMNSSLRIDKVGDGSHLLDSLNEDFTAAQIDGSLTLYLVDPSNGNAVLDTLTLVDVTDGQPVGVVSGNPSLVFTQLDPNTWNPGTITVTAMFYDVNGSVDAVTTGVLEVDQSNGNIGTQVAFDTSAITVAATGLNTQQVGLTFTLQSDTSRFVQETVYSVTQGETGETGLTGATGPSVIYTGGWQVDRGLYYAGTHSGTDPDTGSTGDAIGEVVRFDYNSPTSPKEWHEDHGDYYICTTEHDPLNIVPAAENGAVDTNYWQEFGAQFDSVATGLLLAETVIAQDMFGDTLELTDSFKIASPSGTCTNIAMNLDDADGSGALQSANNTDADETTLNGHWAMGTHRGLLHNDWNTASETTFNLTEATVLAVNAYDVTGTSYKEELLSLQPGSIIELYTDATIDQSSSNLAEDFYDTPFYFKIEEDPTKLGAGQPTGVYMAKTLADVGPTDEYGNNNVSLNVVQLDVLHLPTLPDGTVGNNVSTDYPYDSGVGIKLRIHSGFSTEGECLAHGGTWTPDNQRVELTSSGLQAYNGGGDRTVNIKSADGSFEFGNYSSGQGIQYSAGGLLDIQGTIVIDGTAVNDQMRSVSIGTEVQSFIFQKAYLNFTGSLVSESPYPVVGSGTPYCQGAASWTFTTDNDGPLLIRVAMNDPEGRPSIALNGTELGIGTGGSYKAYWGHHEGASDDETADVQRWYEWYDDGTHAIFGQNTIQLVCSTEVSNCDDGFTLTAVQVFGDVNTEAITIDSTVLNGGSSPIPVWEATQTGNISHSGNSPTIDLATTTNSSAIITLTEFMNHGISNALRSSAVKIQAYYAGGSQTPAWSSDISDTITITRLLPGLPGEQSVTGLLTNESGTIAMDHSGDWSNGGIVLQEHGGIFQIYDGTSLVPAEDVTYTATEGAGTTCAILDPSGDYAVTAISGVDTGVCTLEASYAGITIQKVFTLALSREGATIVGDPAKGVILTSDSSTYVLNEDTTLSPSTINFTAQCINCDSDGEWGGTLLNSLTNSDGSILTTSLASANFADGGTVTYTAAVADGGAVDTITLSKLEAGDSAITVVMSNEAHVLPADVNGAVVDYTGSGTEIRVYQGATELDFDGSSSGPGKWFISGTADSGDIAYDSFTDGGNYAEGGEITGTTDAVDAFTITHTIGGKTLNNEVFSGLAKTRSISKSKTGAAGESGAPSMSHTFTYDTIDGEALSPLNHPSHLMTGGGWTTTGGSNPTEWSVDQSPPAGGPGVTAYKAVDDATNIGDSHGQLWGEWIDIDPQNFYKISVWVYQNGGNQRQYLACDFKALDGTSGGTMSVTVTPSWTSNGTYYYWRMANGTYPANTWTKYEYTICPDGYSGSESCDGGIPLSDPGGSPTVQARVGALVNRDHTGSSAGDGTETSTTVYFSDYKIERITTDDDGRFKVWDGDGTTWTDSSDTTGFQNADMMLLNKKDATGTDRSYIYDNLADGQEVVFFINNNRWYQYIIDSVVDEPDGLGNTVGLSLNYKAHIVDIDSSLSGDIDALDVKFGFSALQGTDGTPGGRGSRTFYSEWCDEGGGWSDAEAEATANEDGGPVLRDTVTLFCDTEAWSTTKFFNGTGDGTAAADWTEVAAVIDGSLVVHGSIDTEQLAADAITAAKIEAGAISAEHLSVGVGGNIIYPRIKDSTNWATDLENQGWEMTGASQVSMGNISKYDPMVQLSSEMATVNVKQDGTSAITIKTPEVEIDPAISYNLGVTFSPQAYGTAGYSKVYIRVEFFDTNGTSQEMMHFYKDGALNGDSWGESQWHGANDQSYAYVYKLESSKFGKTVTTGGGGAHGWMNTVGNYEDYWWTVNCMLHSSATNEDGVKSGGALPAMHDQLVGFEADGGLIGATDSRIGNVRIPSGANTVQVQFIWDVINTGGNAQANDCFISDISLTPAGSTMIDGSSITTGSITADRIDAAIITSDNLTSTLVTAGLIKSAGADPLTFWNLTDGVIVVKDDAGVVRVKLGDLTASDDPPT